MMRTPQFHELCDQFSELLFGRGRAPRADLNDRVTVAAVARRRSDSRPAAVVARRRDRHRRRAGACGRSPAHGVPQQRHRAAADGDRARRCATTAGRSTGTTPRSTIARGVQGLALGQRARHRPRAARARRARRSRRPLLQLGVVSYCLPVVAIGPIFAIVFNGETPKIDPRRAVGVLHHPDRHAGRPAQRRRDQRSTSSARYGGGSRRRSSSRCGCGPACRACSRRCASPPRRGARRDHRRVPRWRAGLGVAMIASQQASRGRRAPGASRWSPACSPASPTASPPRRPAAHAVGAEGMSDDASPMSTAALDAASRSRPPHASVAATVQVRCVANAVGWRAATMVLSIASCSARGAVPRDRSTSTTSSVAARVDVWRYVTDGRRGRRRALPAAAQSRRTTLPTPSSGCARAPSPRCSAPSSSTCAGRSSRRSCRSPWCCGRCRWSR